MNSDAYTCLHFQKKGAVLVKVFEEKNYVDVNLAQKIKTCFDTQGLYGSSTLSNNFKAKIICTTYTYLTCSHLKPYYGRDPNRGTAWER